ncbi:MAG: glycosyltransferase family 2 protein [Planctomycetes bacterium]|nr:glycosyltransferase family 2 protein [Planctomycetota bacterium]
MDLSVVVVTLNGRDMTLSCLESVTPAAAELEHEIIVVDNGSSDGTPQAVRARFPQARLIENGRNCGYGFAANQGMRQARGRYVCLLNNDARLPPSGLRVLAGLLETTPDIGMIGPQLVHEDGRLQHSFDVEPSLATELLNKSLLRRLLRGRFPSRLTPLAGPTDVPNLVGACLLARRSAVEQLGFFDEIFLYLYEETDLCRRARAAGWRVVVHPGVQVVHLQGRTRARVRLRARVEHARSLFAYFRKHHFAQYVLLRFLYPLKSLLESTVFGLLTTLSLGLWPRARRRAAEALVVLAWQLLLCPRGMGLAPSNRP